MDTNNLLKENVKVVGLCGSLRQGSYTKRALQIALNGAAELTPHTELIDLTEYELIFCDGKRPESALPDGVLRLRRKIKDAQGIIIGTPEYHASFSGVLKNALDLMGFDEFEGKMVGLVGVAGGQTGAINALNSLRMVGRSLHAWVIPEQVSIPTAWKLFDNNGQMTSPEIRSRLEEVGRQVARYAFMHSSHQFKNFLAKWEKAPENPGGAG